MTEYADGVKGYSEFENSLQKSAANPRSPSAFWVLYLSTGAFFAILKAASPDLFGGDHLKKIGKILLICLLIFIFTAAAFVLWENGAFILIRTADANLEHTTWNGKEYSPIGGVYTEGRTIAKGKDSWTIDAVREDPTHTFIVVRSFLDQNLMVSDDYTVPTAGELTTVSWNGVYISDSRFLEAISKIEAEKTTSFTYQTEGIFVHTENQYMEEIYFAYENCPVATNFKGYMGTVNGEWVITTEISQDTRNEDGSAKLYPVSCYRIPSQYWDVLSQYFS